MDYKSSKTLTFTGKYVQEQTPSFFLYKISESSPSLEGIRERHAHTLKTRSQIFDLVHFAIPSGKNWFSIC
jgi:hypothetical protein